MPDLFRLTDTQMARLKPCFPRSTGNPSEHARHGRTGRQSDLSSWMLSSLPDVDCQFADRSYDADWFREALKDDGIGKCTPGRKQRKATVR